MTASPIVVGAKGIDSASPSINEATAFADGSRYRFRYSAGAATNPSNSSHGLNAAKLCAPGEIGTIINSGQDFIANDEWYGTRVTEGASAGQQDAAAAGAFWESMGLAKGASIYPSWDAAPNPAQYSQVEAYLTAYNNELAGVYTADGLYAGAPALVALGKAGVIRHGWIPEAASWSCPNVELPDAPPPAKDSWDLWQPTPSQMAYACAYVLALCNGSTLESIIWQNGNHWFPSGGSYLADENVVLLGTNFGSHLQAGGVGPAPTPPPTPPPTPASKMWQGQPVPSLIHQGSEQYLGNINGPAASHGGYYPSEQPIIKMLQQRLIVMGFVSGVTDPNGGWADGIFDIRGNGSQWGPTSQAVENFQKAHMPGTQYYGQVWWDDWTELFINLH